MVSILRRGCGVWVAAAAALCLAGGCGGDDQAKSEDDQAAQKSAAPVASPDSGGSGQETTTSQQPAAVDWDEMLAAAEARVKAEDLVTAQSALAEINASADKLSQSQRDKLAALQAAATGLAAQRAAGEREAVLASAGEKLAAGELDAAQEDANRVLNLGPSDSQRAAATGLLSKIEATRSARRRLAADIRLLESENRRDFNTARGNLLREPEISLPLVLEGTRHENATFAQNCLKLLRWYKRPDKAVPALVGVLADERRQAIWPTAIEEIARLEEPGAGPPLLQLALETSQPEQRTAALTALSHAADPPAGTLAELLPLFIAAEIGDADLAAALHAARRAATLHGQTDVAALRGFTQPLNTAQRRMMAELPGRLAEIAAADSAEGKLGATGRAATALAVALRLSPSRALANVKLTRSSGEDSTAPAAAVLDGQWRTIDPAQMWRHPRDGRPLIAFDLGGEFTITGVRIWNYNEPSYAGRGWREVDVYAGPDPALLNPVSRGVVPPAPCVADPQDYSITLAVPFTYGRYVKLEPKTYWNPNETLGGVTEIEILGF